MWTDRGGSLVQEAVAKGIMCSTTLAGRLTNNVLYHYGDGGCGHNGTHHQPDHPLDQARFKIGKVGLSSVVT